ncbi:MAG: DUF6163 family protein [Xanthobacteraceae bacterium]
MTAIDRETERPTEGPWTVALIWFLRSVAGLSMAKGLYHWSVVIGIGDGPGSSFEASPVAFQAATIFFAVIDLVAAVGLWLAAAWGGVVWLTAAISMAAVELFFPQVYGGAVLIIVMELAAIFAYVGLAYMATRERPE